MLAIIITVILAHFLALISPGPDFLLVVRSAFRNTRRRALGVAAGIAFSNAVYIVLCILGVGAMIAHSLWLMMTLKALGGSFLIYVAYHALKAKRSDYQFIEQARFETADLVNSPSFFKEFFYGMMSGLSNPKNIIFYISLFSVVLKPSMDHGVVIALGVWMTLIVFVWDAMIIFFLSHQKVRAKFAKIAYYFDKVSGVLLGLVGVKLLYSAIKN